MNDERMTNISHDTRTASGDKGIDSEDEKVKLDGLIRENLEKIKTSTRQAQSDEEIEPPSKIVSILTKIIWFFVLWSILHFLFA
jgi:hypothetical protein